MDFRIQQRNQGFMQGPDLSSLRRRHEDFSVEIRKEQRYQQAAKKRLLSQESALVPAESVSTASQSRNDAWVAEDLRKVCPGLQGCGTNRDRLQVLYATLMSATPAEAHLILIAIRHSTCRKPRPIEELVSLGYIPALLHLSNNEDTSISSEATWIISNIASDQSRFTSAVVDQGGVDLYLSLATHSLHIDTQEHVIWTLGNIAGDSIQYRDLLLSKGAHVALCQLVATMQYPLYAKVYRVATWTLSNLIRGSPSPPIPVFAMVLDTISPLFRIKDQDLKLNLYYIIETTSAAGTEAGDQILTRDFLQKIARSVLSKRKLVALTGLRTIGNVASGPEVHTDMLLSAGVLEKLLEVISSNDSQIRRTCLWILSNMAAGSRLQIEKVMSSAVALLAIKAVEDISEKVRVEASYFCYNIVKVGNSTHHRKLITLGFVSHLKGGLRGSSPEAVFNLLIVTDALLTIGEMDAEELQEGLNPTLLMLQEYDCIEEIERYRNSANEKIARKAGGIVDKYLDKAVEEVEMREVPEEFQFS